MNISIRSIAAVALGAAMLSSCGIYKAYELPTGESALIDEYGKALEQPVDSAAFGNLDWHAVFTDPTLQDLIQQALDNNIDLENARLNVEIAHAALKGARLNYLPSVAFAPSGALGKTSIQGTSWSKTYTLPLAVDWEIDIFGKLLNADRKAKAALLQSEAYGQAVRSQIISAVANCYYSLASLQAVLRLQQETAASWKQSVSVMQDFKLAGRVTEAAVVQSRAQYEGILSSIIDTKTQIHELQNTLSLLLGTMPQTWTVAPAGDAVSLTLPAQAANGSVAMASLAARPDVRAAEMGMATAYYATSQARAAFYPGLNITANGGFTNSLGSLIMNPGKWFINLGAQLTAPLFARGSLITNLKVTKLQQQQAINTFEHTLMSAAADVSDALTVYANSNAKLAHIEAQVQNLELAVDYTEELLKSGVEYTTYLEVLTAQQNLLQAQMGLLSTRLNASLAVVNLYQNLGGGR